MSGMIIGSYFYYVAYIGAHYRMYGLLFFFHGLTEIAGLPLVYLISRKFGKQLPFRFTIPVMLLGLAGTMFISPSTARPWMLYLCALFIGFGVSGINMVTSNLYSDLTDVDELIFGKRREGICSGAATFLKKLVSGLSMFLVSAVLGLFGYRETPADWDVAQNGLFPQIPEMITGTRLVFAVIPAAFAIITFICTFLYPVDAAVHRRIQEVIAEKHGRGKADISGEDAVRFEKVTGLPPEKLWAAG
jgi:Na+/melibiose symporter-like transporter